MPNFLTQSFRWCLKQKRNIGWSSWVILIMGIIHFLFCAQQGFHIIDQIKPSLQDDYHVMPNSSQFPFIFLANKNCSSVLTPGKYLRAYENNKTTEKQTFGQRAILICLRVHENLFDHGSLSRWKSLRQSQESCSVHLLIFSISACKTSTHEQQLSISSSQ